MRIVLGRFLCAVIVVLAARAAGQQQPPPRDSGAAGGRLAVPAPVGSGVITGVVVDDDTPPKPVRRATLTLTNAAGGTEQTETSGDDGAFKFEGLVAGRYNLVASRASYVAMAYRARRSGQPGVPIAVGAVERTEGLSMVLPRGAVLTGTVRDMIGRPVARAQVQAVQSGLRDGERALMPLRLMRPADARVSAITDEQGNYRLFGLPAGFYTVRVVRPSDTARLEMYPPSTLDATEAAVVRLEPGEERGGIDVNLPEVSIARVSGVVSNGGIGVADARVTMTRRGALAKSTQTDAQGTFTFADVPFGTYTATAVRPGVAWGVTDVSVAIPSVTDTRIDMRPPMTLRGRVVVDGGTLSVDEMAQVRISAAFMSPLTALGGLRARVLEGGRFEIDDVVPARYRISVTTPPPSRPGDTRLTAKSATVAHVDGLDQLVEITGDAAPEMLVTLTSRIQHVEGTITDRAGTPVVDHSVLVFPVDRALWAPSSRRIKLMRPSTDGHFDTAALPAGDYYIVALSDGEPDDLSDPSFLGQLVPAALRLRLLPGENKIQNVRVGERR